MQHQSGPPSNGDSDNAAYLGKLRNFFTEEPNPPPDATNPSSTSMAALVYLISHKVHVPRPIVCMKLAESQARVR